MALVKRISKSDNQIITDFLEHAESVILGKPEELKLMLTCLLAQGHLLIEDVPGVGKTTFVKTIQVLIGLDFNRIQFTNDMLPADIIGGSIFNQHSQEFEFKKGPIFCQMVMADEINRATPKTQSACLQAMEERQISIDSQTLPLPSPFVVVATQNPESNIGTFPLPESQLDRFMMRIRIGFPSREAEKRLLVEPDRKSILTEKEAIFSPQDLLKMQKSVKTVHISELIIEYIQDVLARSRAQGIGLSPRAALDLVASTKAYAFIDGRDFVKPQDVQDVAVAVINHRLNSNGSQSNGWDEAQSLIDMVPVR